MWHDVFVWLIGYGSIMSLCYLFKYAEVLGDGNIGQG